MTQSTHVEVTVPLFSHSLKMKICRPTQPLKITGGGGGGGGGGRRERRSEGGEREEDRGIVHVLSRQCLKVRRLVGGVYKARCTMYTQHLTYLPLEDDYTPKKYIYCFRSFKHTEELRTCTCIYIHRKHECLYLL